MLRDDNPYASAMSGSICHFSFLVNTINLIPSSKDLFINLREKKGFLNGDFKSGLCSFNISHDDIDAFGGMAIASQLYNDLNLPKLEPRKNVGGEINEYCYAQESKILNHFGDDNSKSLSQNFLKKIIHLLLKHSINLVAIPVRLERLESLSSDHYWGNSFVIVELEISRLIELIELPKKVWAQELMSRAERVLKVGERRGITRPDLKSKILFSLIGDVSRYDWFAKEFSPSTFCMIPTPKDNSTLHCVLWSRSQEVALSTCVHRQNQIPLSREIIEVWRQLS